MEGSVIDLLRYCYETAKDDLDTAKVMFKAEKYKAAVNRSYYDREKADYQDFFCYF